MSSGQDAFDHLTVNVCEPVLTALKAIGQPFVIETEAAQNRCLEIVDVDGVFRDVKGKVVRLAVDPSRFDATTREPDGKCAAMMIATVVCLRQSSLAVNRAAKFAAPNHERVIQQTALLQ